MFSNPTSVSELITLAFIISERVGEEFFGHASSPPKVEFCQMIDALNVPISLQKTMAWL